MNLKKILYLTDLKEADLSFDLLKGMLSLKQLGLEEVLFLQSTQSDEWFKELSRFKIKSKLIIEEESLLQRIFSLAREEEISLIVVNLACNAKKTSRISIMKKLINGTSLPLLFVNSAAQGTIFNGNGLFSHVVFATDWSHSTEKAFGYILGIKKIIGELEIVTVINKKLTVGDMRELKERLSQTRKICLDEKINAESHVYAGRTSEEMLTAARDYKASIIITGGETKRKGINGMFKGSSLYKITGETDLPVLVVH